MYDIKCYSWLFILLLLLNVPFVSYAATCDDVRQLYGKNALDTEEYHDYVSYVDTLGDLSSKRDNSLSIINAQERKDKLYAKFDSLLNEKSDAVNKLLMGMQSGEDALSLIGETKNIIDLDITLKAYNLEQEDFNLENSAETYNKLNSAIGNNRIYLFDSYDIGELGGNKSWPLSRANNFVLKGYKSPGSENGVYLSANKSENVYAIYSGIVTKIEHSDVYGNWMEVQSGKGLSISYSFISSPLVNIGDEVLQGESIANIKNDSLYIEAILDSEYINPMLLLGDMGIKENNRWIYSNIAISDKSTLLDNSSYKYEPTRKIWDTTNPIIKGGTDKVSIEEVNQFEN